MTTDGLVERVAIVFLKTPGKPSDRFRAAIALALEEAARVAENSPHWTDNGPPLGKMPTGRGDIAAAIRAMIPKESA